MNQRVEAAIAAHKAAAKAVIAAVESEYPLGATIKVCMGGRVLDVEVVGHSSAWWSSPGEILGRNIRTDKIRRFTAMDVVSTGGRDE